MVICSPLYCNKSEVIIDGENDWPNNRFSFFFYTESFISIITVISKAYRRIHIHVCSQVQLAFSRLNSLKREKSRELKRFNNANRLLVIWEHQMRTSNELVQVYVSLMKNRRCIIFTLFCNKRTIKLVFLFCCLILDRSIRRPRHLS